MTEEEKVRKRLYPSYHRPLETAREWVRGGKYRAAAVGLLRALRDQHRHVLEIGHELVLALLEAGRPAEAETELKAIDRDFPEVDEETLCRFGRRAKEEADAALAVNDLDQADALYWQALAWYERGYAQTHGQRINHYSGINKATVLLLLAGVAEARGKKEESREFLSEADRLAADLLAKRSEWKRTYPDDNVWHLATAGEAFLLRKMWRDAAQAYRRAFTEPQVKPFHPETAGKQARRILDAWDRLGVTPGPEEFPVDTLFAPPHAGGPAAAPA